MSDQIGGVKRGTKLSFVDAAKAVLRQEGCALHYAELTERAVEAGILGTKGATPEITMHVSLMASIKEAQRRGETPDLVKTSRGYFALVAKGPPDVEEAVKAVRAKVRAEILQRMRKMNAEKFHRLIVDLMVAMGYRDVEIVDGPGDRQVDIVGVIEAGGVPLKIAVQAKAFASGKKVSEQAARALRHALHQCWHGWFVTTGFFTPEAKAVPGELPHKRPLSLTDGEALADLMMENEVGVDLLPLSVPRLASGGPFAP
jgi:restriction endonuclease Mrr